MTSLASRTWVPANCETYIQELAGETSRQSAEEVRAAIQAAIDENRRIHEGNASTSIRPPT